MNSNFPKNYKNSQTGGFVDLVMAVILSIVMLHLLGINIENVLARPETKSVALFIRDIFVLVWNDLVKVFVFIKDIIKA
jgi:hypothetical protein